MKLLAGYQVLYIATSGAACYIYAVFCLIEGKLGIRAIGISMMLAFSFVMMSAFIAIVFGDFIFLLFLVVLTWSRKKIIQKIINPY